MIRQYWLMGGFGGLALTVAIVTAVHQGLHGLLVLCLLAGVGLVCLALVLGLIFILDLKHRRPEESLWRFWLRSDRELREDTKLLYSEQPPQHYYVRLACGHRAQIVAQARPQGGELVYCPAHTACGPARPTIIQLTDDHGKDRTILGLRLP